MKFTLKQMIQECDRELIQRKNVYPRLINQGKLTKAKANEQFLILQHIKQFLIKEHEKNVGNQSDLFGPS